MVGAWQAEPAPRKGIGDVLRFGYSTINWGETPDVAAMLAQIGEAGWRAIEFFGHSLDWLGTPARLTEQLQERNLRAATFFGSVHLPADRIQLGKLQRHIDYAAALGADAFGIVGGSRLRWQPPPAEEYADLAQLCEELAAYGVAQGVTVAYHPHVACTVETEAEIDRLLDQTQVLMLCLDASHIALVGEDPIAHLRKYRDRTGYIHLKDWARGKFVEMGQGSIGIDFAAVFHELEEHDFGRWVIVEQSRSDVSPLDSAQINSSYLRSLGYDPSYTGSTVS